MAGRTRSRQRRLMLLLAATASVSALAQSPAPTPATRAVTANIAAAAPEQTPKRGKHNQPQSPDPALIAFLGDYADAADGLDPMGLPEHADTVKKATTEPHKP